jgi:hypothetical protein
MRRIKWRQEVSAKPCCQFLSPSESVVLVPLYPECRKELLGELEEQNGQYNPIKHYIQKQTDIQNAVCNPDRRPVQGEENPSIFGITQFHHGQIEKECDDEQPKGKQYVVDHDYLPSDCLKLNFYGITAPVLHVHRGPTGERFQQMHQRQARPPVHQRQKHMRLVRHQHQYAKRTAHPRWYMLRGFFPTYAEKSALCVGWPL